MSHLENHTSQGNMVHVLGVSRGIRWRAVGNRGREFGVGLNTFSGSGSAKSQGHYASQGYGYACKKTNVINVTAFWGFLGFKSLSALKQGI